MRCLLAVDTGGTKCETIAVGEDGALLGWGHCGYPNPASGKNARGGSGRSAETINTAIEQALRGVEFSELHIASYHHQWSLDDVLGDRLPVEVVYHPIREHDGVLELVGLESGIIASAGTGAFVLAIARDGRELHLDGLGPILGDYGSAYHIGALAVQAAAKCDWHPRHTTSLNEVVHQALGLTETGSLGSSLIGVFAATQDRAVIANLARLVDAEAERGDAVANAIIEEAASSLAQTVYDAYDGLQMRDCGYSLVGTGSVIEKSAIYRRQFSQRVREFAPDLGIVWTDLPHVVGNALSALHKIVSGDVGAAKDKLMLCAREVES